MLDLDALSHIIGTIIATQEPSREFTAQMRIRIIQGPTQKCIDGVQLDRFRVGAEYEVGTALGAVFLTEGWGELVLTFEPAVAIPPSELTTVDPPNLVRELQPPYYEGPPIVVERRRLPRIRTRRR